MKRQIRSSKLKQLTAEEIANAIPYPDDADRPTNYERDCMGGPRPCPFVSCEKNTYLSVGIGGAINLTWPDKQPEDVDPEWSCVEDIARRGQTFDAPMEFKDVAKGLGIKTSGAQGLCMQAQEHAKKIRDDMGRAKRRDSAT